MLDIDVVTVAMRYVSATGTPQAAESDCLAAADAFTGAELASLAIGAPRDLSPAALLSGYCMPLLLADALTRRGALLLNTAGQIGITVGRRMTVQPAGRIYALVPTDREFWLSGWWPSAVTATLAAS